VGGHLRGRLIRRAAERASDQQVARHAGRYRGDCAVGSVASARGARPARREHDRHVGPRECRRLP
jgi:hypothetical protein